MTPAEIAATVVSCVAVAAIVAYAIYQIVHAVRTRPAYRTKDGLEVRHEAHVGSCISEPLPKRAEVERELARVADVVSAWRFSLGRVTPAPNYFDGLVLFWMPAARCSRMLSGEVKPSEYGELLYFFDPSNPPSHRRHDYYAGRRSGNQIKVAWTGSVADTALAHEIGHVVAEAETGDYDVKHTRFPELWEALG